MKLLSFLKEVLIENNGPSSIIKEIAEKYRQQLLTKFQQETTDKDEEILRIIDLFDRYKNGFPADKRDIMVYLKPENYYIDLKSMIVSKENIKGIDNLYKEFKKKDPKAPNDVKKYIKQFSEIQSLLPESKRDVLSYDYLELVNFLQQNYPTLIQKRLAKVFSNLQGVTKDQLVYYITSYLEIYNQIPADTKRVDDMSFPEFEHLIDGLKMETEDTKKEDSYEGVDLIYDQNNLKIFAPKTKDQCIMLKNGRSWCTSREGSGNMYYNYRLNNERTLYYVIDEDKPFKDLDFAVVVLVDPDGDMALADGSNSGRYSGHGNIPWDEIVKKIPKLDGLKDLFVAKPLTSEEKEMINKVSRIRVGDNPYESLGEEKWVEVWLEYNSPTLSDEQYSRLSIPLKKKYIALGMDLSGGQIGSSEPEVLKYYANKKIESIKQKTLSNLRDPDITLLNSPMFKKIKEELKPKLTADLSSVNGTKVEIIYPNSDMAKYLALYDMNELFDAITNDNKILHFAIENSSKTQFKVTIPPTISKLKSLKTLILNNCIDSLPEEIGSLTNLEFLTLKNNPNLTQLPASVQNLRNIVFANFEGCNNLQLPDWWETKYETFEGTNLWSEKEL
jgi:Leucine-rich repeat (LRR) protein